MSDKPDVNEGPLRGVRVLDFSRIIAGPLCTQHLADMGADVVKVEHPVTGDDGRRFSRDDDDRGYFFVAFNRSKRSVAMDVRKDGARAPLEALIRWADVLIENFRPGVMTRLGLDPETVMPLNERLIYASVSAFGQTGSQSHRPGLDPVLQAETGMMAVTGEPDGAPMRTAQSLIDTLTAAHATSAITAALFARERTGCGQYVELSLLDTAVTALGNVGTYVLDHGEDPPRSGNAHITATPTGLFETATDPIYVAMATDRLFEQLCRDVLERPDLVEDPRFSSSGRRLENRPALFEILNGIFSAESADSWMERLRHLPAGRVRSVTDALASPEIAERQLVQTIRDGDKDLQTLGLPYRFSGTPHVAFRPPPHLGEHTVEVLADLGFGDDEIAEMLESGVLRKS
jgi:crotonobetainyl-CoA:carnitine CoA-transferase CaiB-like acyl-CoA transferase